MAKRITEKNEQGYTRVKDGAGKEVALINNGNRFPDFLTAGDVVERPMGRKEEVKKVQYIESDDVYIVVSEVLA